MLHPTGVRRKVRSYAGDWPVNAGPAAASSGPICGVGGSTIEKYIVGRRFLQSSIPVGPAHVVGKVWNLGGKSGARVKATTLVQRPSGSAARPLRLEDMCSLRPPPFARSTSGCGSPGAVA